ncbi:hypothetical protein EYF80_013967 [Liparis tanakae]|uniref:Uncharacterized protein n=1 Tax=Liparis tanakae TaxID=230148 RepID=A0A4Z2ICZ0_9TELE|nr:hypothetical protein EYF80_013967 [Liparis tanakae]
MDGCELSVEVSEWPFKPWPYINPRGPTRRPTQVPLALFAPLPSPPVRLDISGTSLIIRLQWSAMLTGCPLMAVPLSLHRGSTAAAAAVCGGECSMSDFCFSAKFTCRENKCRMP